MNTFKKSRIKYVNITLALFLAILGSIFLIIPIQDSSAINCPTEDRCDPSCTTNCFPGYLTNCVVNGDGAVCLGTSVDFTASANHIPGYTIETCTNECCDVTNSISTNGVGTPSCQWSVSPSTPTSTNGCELTVTPTNCGNYIVTVTFSVSECNTTITCSASADLAIIMVDIVPDSTNALINECLFPSQTVGFDLSADSCGGVVWSIEPAGLTDGATINSHGTVTIGEIATNYTIVATSIDNTNCSDTASLSLNLDCVCSNHTISANVTPIPDKNSGGCGQSDGWMGDSVESACGEAIYLECVGYVRLDLGGNLVGHCPYDISNWDALCWKCQCGAVFMKTAFNVVNTDTTSASYGHGKVETWTCTGGWIRNCDTRIPATVNGARTARACDGDDSIEP